MTKSPSMRRPYTAARLPPARSSAGLMGCGGMETWRLENETRYSTRFSLRFLAEGLLVQHPHPRRANPQSEERQPRAAARAARRDHRPLGLRQELARLRHALRRRPAPLRRVALGLRAPVP